MKIWGPARRKVKKDTIELNKLFKSDGYSGNRYVIENATRNGIK